MNDHPLGGASTVDPLEEKAEDVVNETPQHSPPKSLESAEKISDYFETVGQQPHLEEYLIAKIAHYFYSDEYRREKNSKLFSAALQIPGQLKNLSEMLSARAHPSMLLRELFKNAESIQKEELGEIVEGEARKWEKMSIAVPSSRLQDLAFVLTVNDDTSLWYSPGMVDLIKEGGFSCDLPKFMKAVMARSDAAQGEGWTVFDIFDSPTAREYHAAINTITQAMPFVPPESFFFNIKSGTLRFMAENEGQEWYVKIDADLFPLYSTRRVVPATALEDAPTVAENSTVTSTKEKKKKDLKLIAQTIPERFQGLVDNTPDLVREVQGYAGTMIFPKQISIYPVTRFKRLRTTISDKFRRSRNGIDVHCENIPEIHSVHYLSGFPQGIYSHEFYLDEIRQESYDGLDVLFDVGHIGPKEIAGYKQKNSLNQTEQLTAAVALLRDQSRTVYLAHPQKALLGYLREQGIAIEKKPQKISMIFNDKQGQPTFAEAKHCYRVIKKE